MSNAKLLYWIANSCSCEEFSVIFIYNFVDVRIVTNIDIAQVTTDIVSWCINFSDPTEKLLEKTDRIITGISKYLEQFK